MSYSMNRRALGQTAPSTPAVPAEDRRALPSIVTVALLIGTAVFALNMYAKDVEQPAYGED